MDFLALAQQTAELQDCINDIVVATTIPASAIKTVMFPGGRFNQDFIRACLAVGMDFAGAYDYNGVNGIPIEITPEASINVANRSNFVHRGWVTPPFTTVSQSASDMDAAVAGRGWIRYGGHNLADITAAQIQAIIEMARAKDIWIATKKQIYDYAVANPTNRTCITGMETGLKSGVSLSTVNSQITVTGVVGAVLKLQHIDLCQVTMGNCFGVAADIHDVTMDGYGGFGGLRFRISAEAGSVINSLMTHDVYLSTLSDALITITDLCTRNLSISTGSPLLTINGYIYNGVFFPVYSCDASINLKVFKNARCSLWPQTDWSASLNGSAISIEGGENDFPNEINLWAKTTVNLSSLYAAPVFTNKWVHIRSGIWTFNVNVSCRKAHVYTGNKLIIGAGLTTTITVGRRDSP